MKPITRRDGLGALFAASLGALMACTATPATAEDGSLLFIEVEKDVGEAAAHILLDGQMKGVVGPGCALILLVENGPHRLEYVWHSGSIGHDIVVVDGEVTAVRIVRGPEIVPATAKGPQSPACA